MSTIRCSICQEVFSTEDSTALPFCSDRCKAIDLARWLGEEYGLPVETDDESPREEWVDE